MKVQKVLFILIKICARSLELQTSITYKDEAYRFNEDLYDEIIKVHKKFAPYGEGFKKLKDCLAGADEWIEKGKLYLEHNPEHLKRIIKSYKYCMKNGLIIMIIIGATMTTN